MQTLEQQGKAFYQAGRFTQAVTVLQQAVRSYQQQGSTIAQAIALSNLALTYHQLGDWTQANDRYLTFNNSSSSLRFELISSELLRTISYLLPNKLPNLLHQFHW